MLAATLAGAATAGTSWAQSAAPRVKLVTSAGDIVVELDPAKAPKTVANFLQYVKDKQYEGTIFHRVIDGFMIQGGGMTPDFRPKSTRTPIENEARNGLKNERYSVAMARTGDPHSATAQFFINVADNDFLNYRSADANGWGYCVFGRVVAGTDVVDRIKALPTGNRGAHQNVPNENVIIERVEEVTVT
jgi:peptidyl-prolyl cis-trans isomerase B (cyclophilin B)